MQADLASREARQALEGVDLCFHLGFQLWAGDGASAMARVNLAGTSNVLAARPGAVVFASSAAVYGAWPDNPLPIGEDHPPRPNSEVTYAIHKREAERRCLDAAPTVVLRLAAVLGPHADAAVARSVNGYRLAVPAISGVGQAVQWLDENDAVSALMAAGRALVGAGIGVHVPGRPAAAGAVYNIGTSDWLDAPGMAAVTGGRVVSVPRTLLLRASELGRRAHLLPFGADRAALLNGPLALDTARAAAELGWTPTRTSAAVLADAVRRPADRGATPGTGGRPWPPTGC